MSFQQWDSFSEQERTRILNVLRDKARRPVACPVCTSRKYTLVDGFVFLPIHARYQVLGWAPDPVKITSPSTTIPCIALVCNECGHTFLLNVITLGLQDLLPESLQGQYSNP